MKIYLSINLILEILTFLLISHPSLYANEEGITPRKSIAGRFIIEDSAGFFSEESQKKAKEILGEVKDSFVREMSVKSFKEIPESKKKEYDMATPANRTGFFLAWTKEEAQKSRARGIYVLINKNPGEIVVITDGMTRKHGFTVKDEEQVRDLFLNKFREAAKLEKPEEKQNCYNQALIQAAEFVRDSYIKISR